MSDNKFILKVLKRGQKYPSNLDFRNIFPQGHIDFKTTFHQLFVNQKFLMFLQTIFWNNDYRNMIRAENWRPLIPIA